MRKGLILSAIFLGPLTGPLFWGCVECVRGRQWAMAGVYALGIAGVAVGLPFVAAYLLTQPGVF